MSCAGFISNMCWDRGSVIGWQPCGNHQLLGKKCVPDWLASGCGRLLHWALVTSSSPVVCNTNLDFPTFANYSLSGSKDVKSAIWKQRPFTFRVKAVLLTSIGNNKTRVSLWRWTLSFSGMHGSVSSVTTAQCYLASVFRQFSHLHKLWVITAIW